MVDESTEGRSGRSLKIADSRFWMGPDFQINRGDGYFVCWDPRTVRPHPPLVERTRLRET